MQNNVSKEVQINQVTDEIDQDRYHPCPACEYCTRERIPDRCTCFRQCKKYRHWLRLTWEMVIEPLRRARMEAIRKAMEKKAAEKNGALPDGVSG
ncbi:MAG: hypothetical protein IJY66_06580 [Clostridia bacterium]|nr:hypothetical protein [Clostridia bacterium]